MSTEAERLSVLETQREAHEDRHGAFEKVLEDSFARIDRNFEAGSKKFAALSDQIGAVHTTLTNHCTATNHNDNPGNRRSRRRDIAVKLGVPIISGGGFVAFVIYLLERLSELEHLVGG